jgi:hypothetical protein
MMAVRMPSLASRAANEGPDCPVPMTTASCRGSLTNGIVITMFGRIPFPDRLQRIFLGACLMALTFLGLLESMDWKKWTALVLQTELLFTGLAGWCPIYWACRVGPHTNNKKSKKSPEIEQ